MKGPAPDTEQNREGSREGHREGERQTAQEWHSSGTFSALQMCGSINLFY